MADSYKLIGKVVASSGTIASATFSSIPQTFSDLLIVISARDPRTLMVDSAVLYFNGDTTGGNYSMRRIFGDAATAQSDTNASSGAFITGANATASTFGISEVYIPNYASANLKTQTYTNAAETMATTTYMGLGARSWNNTSAITSISIFPETQPTFDQYSSFYLYGIRNS